MDYGRRGHAKLAKYRRRDIPDVFAASPEFQLIFINKTRIIFMKSTKNPDVCIFILSLYQITVIINAFLCVKRRDVF